MTMTVIQAEVREIGALHSDVVQDLLYDYEARQLHDSIALPLSKRSQRNVCCGDV